jgi:hypothetical protein
MKILPLKHIPNYRNTNLTFSNIESATQYTEFLKQDFLLKRAKTLEFLLSKRKKKKALFSKPKKYLLTKQGNKFLLWEQMN